nr:hypothetical protein [uncultured Kingella sp.]
MGTRCPPSPADNIAAQNSGSLKTAFSDFQAAFFPLYRYPTCV